MKNRTALKAEIEGAFAAYDVDALTVVMEKAGVPCGRVRTVAEAVQDPQVDARQMLLPLNDKDLGDFRVLGNPIKLSNHPQGAIRRPPKKGEHTAEILAELRSEK